MAMTETGQEAARDFSAFASSFFSGPMVDAVVRTTESYGKACLAWQEEIMRFAATRLQRDTELGQALAGTRSWTDAAKLQQEWAASAIRDYTTGTTRLFEIAADVGSKITESPVPSRSVAERMAAESVQAGMHASRAAGEAASAVAEEARAETRGSEPPRPRPARRAASSTE